MEVSILSTVYLTQYEGSILGPIAKVLGWIMEGIFFLIDKIGLPYIGLAIILFTIVIYLLLMPLTIKQQKFSKLSAKMNPELQAIQNKYKNKKDNDSMMAMQQETQAVYAKYGVSPSGSCVQLIIQMPILFALYRVIDNIPAYVGKVKEAFNPVVDALVKIPESVDFISNTENFSNAAMYAKRFASAAESGNTDALKNVFVDVLNKASTSEWAALTEKFPQLADEITETTELLGRYNSFLTLNMANSPSFMMKDALANHNWLMLIMALMVPVLAAGTQWLNTKLMPQAESSNSGNDSMQQSMKMMNTMMPLMSAVFCLTLPSGLGLYWIAGAVVRSIQQVAINKYIDRMDMDEVIKKNIEKRDAKLRKKGIDPNKVNNYANINTRSVNAAKPVAKASAMTQEEKDEALRKATEYYNKSAAKPGSITAKANMVKEYNERNNKK